MRLKHNYWYFAKAVNKEKCDKIISLCLKQKKFKSEVEGPEKGKNLRRTDIRDCKISWISSKWIYSILNPFIHSANKQAGWNFQWDWNESCQFTTYEKSHRYNWHNDQVHLTQTNENFKNKIRKLSLTLQLTDPSKYSGGEFQLKWFDGGEVRIITAKDAKELGTIIIFPSFVFHQITPIIKGRRQALVNWSIGKPFL